MRGDVTKVGNTEEEILAPPLLMKTVRMKVKYHFNPFYKYHFNPFYKENLKCNIVSPKESDGITS